MLIKIKEDIKFQNFLFCSINMKQLYLKFNDVLLIDSTYNTNKYKLPLLVFAGINEEAKTFIIGFAVLQSEKIDDVKWALENLFEYLEVHPQIICTDSCPTLKTVIRTLLPQTNHLLCGWHVSQNIKSHLSGISIENFTFCLIF